VVYQLRVFSRRHKATAGAIAAIFVILTATSVTSLSMYFLGASARTDAIVAQESEAEQRRLAEEREQRARQRAAEAEAARAAEAAQREAAEAAAFQARELARLLPEMIRSEARRGRRIDELTELVDRTAERIAEELADQPDVLADLRRTLAETLQWQLGDNERAEPLIRAVVEHHRDIGDVHSTEFASLLRMHAETLWGDPAAQEALLREALAIYREHSDEDGRDVLATLIPLGGVLQNLNRLDEAESTLREAIRLSEELGGDDGRWRSEKYQRLAEVMRRRGDDEEAERLYRQALAVARGEPETEREQLAQMLQHLADFLTEKGELPEAAELYREMYDLHRADFDPDFQLGTGFFIGNERAMKLAEVLRELGDEAGADAVLVQHLEYCRGALSEDHEITTAAVLDMVNFYVRGRRSDRVDEVAMEHVERCRDQLGPDHEGTLRALDLLGLYYAHYGRHQRATTVFREVLQHVGNGAVLDAAHRIEVLDGLRSSLLALGRTDEARSAGAEQIALYADLAARNELEQGGYLSHNNYAWLLLTVEPVDLRDPTRALPIAERAVAMSERRDASRLDTLAVAHSMLGHLDEAIAIEREALALAPMDWQLTDTLVRFLRQKGDDEAAEQVLREALAALPLEWSANRERLTGSLVRLLEGRGDRDAAEALLRETVAAFRSVTPGDKTWLAIALILHGRCLIRNGKLAEAESVLRECLALRREVLEPDDWLVGNAMSVLGEALSAQNKFEEAQPLLVEGYERIRDRAWQIPSDYRVVRRQESIQRLIDLYDARGSPEDAARWRAVLAELPPGAAAPDG
jgi:tetratricopeptide (TPR) repeat protein